MFALFLPTVAWDGYSRRERRKQTTLWILRGTFLVPELEDRFPQVVYCSRTVHRARLLLGTVNNPPTSDLPVSLILTSWLFQCSDIGSITSLEPSTDPQKNTAAYSGMENRVVLGGDITKDVRVHVHTRTQPRLF